MNILSSPADISRLSQRWRREGRLIGFVPTMGALHSAHASLIARARRECGRVIVSVFVNPMQFGPREDFARYPRPFARDAALCGREGADALYRPKAAAMYPDAFDTQVSVGSLSKPLCGRLRPGHFQGVATVVLKLLAQTRPDRLYLGEKDFQQLAVLRRMAKDLDLPVRIVACSTKREKDGLAISSRNRYLSPQERRKAPALFRALKLGAALARKPGASPARIRRRMLVELEKTSGVRADYMEIVDARTLTPPKRLKGRLRLLGAVRIGNTRLIDNIALTV